MLCSELREAKFKSQKITKSVSTFKEWAKRRCLENASERVYFPFLDLATQVSFNKKLKTLTLNYQIQPSGADRFEPDSLNSTMNNSRVSEVSNLTVLEEHTIQCELCEKQFEEQRILYCGTCRNYFHYSCAKVTEEPELPWECDVCKEFLL